MTPLQHEALDRTHIMLQFIETSLVDHPFIADIGEFTVLVDEVLTKLNTLYQAIGAYDENA